ncbi:MAG: site-2 protease family protein [Armatimonadetes bacterium]|nr:site-2 protease family protein [Armatimonadota bacterium]
MFGSRIHLFKLFGFDVGIDASWFIIFFLLTWSLASGLFPARYEGLDTVTYWIMGVIGAACLFLSVVAHEFSHAMVARRYGIPMRGITLFIFGGIAEMTEEPKDATSEFMMAVAGPISSFFIAGIFYLLSRPAWPLPVEGVLTYLAGINLLLALFNLVPAYPLDGGRILRSALWKWKGNIRWATKIAYYFGSGFGLLLMFLGVLSIFAGNLVGGIWWILIGMFLRNAAAMSYQQVIVRKALEGEPVRRFMKTDVVTVPPSATLEEWVNDYVYRYHHKMFPVMEDDLLVGCITTERVKEIPREEWSRRTVGSVADGCTSDNVISPDADAVKALMRMRQKDLRRLMVTEDGRLVGILTLRDLLDLLALRMELEEFLPEAADSRDEEIRSGRLATER